MIELPKELCHMDRTKLDLEYPSGWFNTIHYTCYDDIKSKHVILTTVEYNREFFYFIRASKNWDKSSFFNHPYLCKILDVIVDGTEPHVFIISEEPMMNDLTTFIDKFRKYSKFNYYLVKIINCLAELISSLKNEKLKFAKLLAENIFVDYDYSTNKVNGIKVRRVSLIPFDFEIKVNYESDVEIHHMSYDLAKIALYALTEKNIEDTYLSKDIPRRLSTFNDSSYTPYIISLLCEKSFNFKNFNTILFEKTNSVRKINPKMKRWKRRILENGPFLGDKSDKIIYEEMNPTEKDTYVISTKEFNLVENINEKVNTVSEKSITEVETIPEKEPFFDDNSEEIDSTAKDTDVTSTENSDDGSSDGLVIPHYLKNYGFTDIDHHCQDKHDFGYNIPNINLLFKHKPILKICDNEIEYKENAIVIIHNHNTTVVSFCKNEICKIQFATFWGDQVFTKFSEVNSAVKFVLSKLITEAANYFDKKSIYEIYEPGDVKGLTVSIMTNDDIVYNIGDTKLNIPQGVYMFTESTDPSNKFEKFGEITPEVYKQSFDDIKNLIDVFTKVNIKGVKFNL